MDKRKKIIGAMILFGILIAIIGLVPQTLTLLKGGFDDPLIKDQFNFYITTATIFGLGVIIFFLLDLFINKGDAKYGDGLGFYSMGEKPHFKFFGRFTAIQITWLSLILLLILGLFNITTFSQTAFGARSYTGTGFLETQQFDAMDSTLFSTFLIPAAENLGAAFVIAFLIFWTRFFARKYNWSSFNFRFLAFFLVVVGLMLFGLAWHNQVYPDSEIAQTKVAMFWGLGGLLTMATGIFTVFWNMHIVNNLFIDLARFFSNEMLATMFGIGIIALIALYGYVYRGRLLGER
jgi:hypothetical protein